MSMKEMQLRIKFKQITKYKLNEQEFSKIALRAINGMVA